MPRTGRLVSLAHEVAAWISTRGGRFWPKSVWSSEPEDRWSWCSRRKWSDWWEWNSGGLRQPTQISKATWYLRHAVSD